MTGCGWSTQVLGHSHRQSWPGWHSHGQRSGVSHTWPGGHGWSGPHPCVGSGTHCHRQSRARRARRVWPAQTLLPVAAVGGRCALLHRGIVHANALTLIDTRRTRGVAVRVAVGTHRQAITHLAVLAIVAIAIADARCGRTIRYALAVARRASLGGTGAQRTDSQLADLAVATLRLRCAGSRRQDLARAVDARLIGGAIPIGFAGDGRVGDALRDTKDQSVRGSRVWRNTATDLTFAAIDVVVAHIVSRFALARANRRTGLAIFAARRRVAVIPGIALQARSAICVDKAADRRQAFSVHAGRAGGTQDRRARIWLDTNTINAGA